MAELKDYKIKGPNGVVKTIRGPVGATEEQLTQASYEAFGIAPKQPQSSQYAGMTEDQYRQASGYGDAPIAPEMAAQLGLTAPEVYQPPPQRTLGERLGGAAETAQALVLGSPAALAGMVSGGISGALEYPVYAMQGKELPPFGEFVEKAAEYGAGKMSAPFMPTSEAGQKYTQKTAEALRYVTEPFGPMGAMPEMVALSAARASLPRVSPVVTKPVTMAERVAPVLEQAEKAGVSVKTSDIVRPESFAAKTAQFLGERIPIFGTGGSRKVQQRERISAVQDLLEEYGATSSAEVATEAVLKDVIGKRKEDLSKYARMKAEVFDSIDKDATVPVGNTVAKIDEEIGKLKSINNKNLEPAISELENWKGSIQNQNIRNIEENRKLVGDVFKSAELSTVRGTADKSLSSIYGVLNDDLGNFIRSTTGESGYAKWKVANKQLSEMTNDLKVGGLKSLLERGEFDSTKLESMLFGEKPGDVKQIMRGTTAEGRNNAKIALLSNATKGAVDDIAGIEYINPDRFAKNVQKKAKNFGLFFDKNEMDRINGLVSVLNTTKRASIAGVMTPTGMQNYYSELLKLFGIGSVGAVSGAGVLPAVAGAVGVGTAARVYESAPVRNLLLRLSKIEKGTSEYDKLVQQVSEEMMRQASKVQKTATVVSRPMEQEESAQ
jgi:hypothetical protein